jgi:16S rRNA (cytidine1402-2'-O)-methyltransferase
LSLGTLFVVATPIGNLADASPRSVEVLRTVAVIACEDTRTTRTLLARYAIQAKTFALHEHNEQAASATLIAMLQDGKDVALVSDAGTPGISDPGARLVEEAYRAGARVSPIPGPSAAVAALSASGFRGSTFFFGGFLPASTAARRKALQALDVPWPVVFFEAPHRIAAMLADLVTQFGGTREICIARELTKKFEDTARIPLGQAQQWLAADPHREQGEFVIVLAPGELKSAAALDADRVLEALLGTLPPSDAAKLAARITGLPKAVLYRKALERSK